MAQWVGTEEAAATSNKIMVLMDLAKAAKGCAAHLFLMQLLFDVV